MTRQLLRCFLTFFILLSGEVDCGECRSDHAVGSFPVTLKRQEGEFRFTVRQQNDFSCGAAALATLLIHHYDEPVTEEEVFEAMFQAGNKEKIRAQGFSMLDMKVYLDRKGYDSGGFEVTLDRLAAIGLPAIVLLSFDGLNHFVVVKGVSDAEVLIGDPALGIRSLPRRIFETMWNGMIFIVRSKMDVGRRNFNRKSEWQICAGAVMEDAPGFP